MKRKIRMKACRHQPAHPANGISYGQIRIGFMEEPHTSEMSLAERMIFITLAAHACSVRDCFSFETVALSNVKGFAVNQCGVNEKTFRRAMLELEDRKLIITIQKRAEKMPLVIQVPGLTLHRQRRGKIIGS